MRHKGFTLNPSNNFGNINFNNNQIVFEKTSGEIVNYSQTQNTITIINTNTTETTTLVTNEYGVIDVQ
jgi:hypothetical protein